MTVLKNTKALGLTYRCEENVGTKAEANQEQGLA
jgi:hypothetical protein